MTSQPAGRVDRPSYIELPPRSRLVTTQGMAPDRLAFPIEVRGRIGGLGWLFLVPMTLVFDVFAALCLALLATPGWPIGLLIGVPIAVLPATVLTARLAYILRDKWSSAASVVISYDGLLDRRISDEKINWSDVNSVRYFSNLRDPLSGCLEFRLNRSVVLKQPRSLLHTIVHLHRQSPDRVLFPLVFLEMPIDRLMTIVYELVRVHGGEVEHYHAPDGVHLGP